MEVLRRCINESEAPEAQLDLIENFFLDRERVRAACTETGRALQ
jgi:hypothetical protein